VRSVRVSNVTGWTQAAAASIGRSSHRAQHSHAGGKRLVNLSPAARRSPLSPVASTRYMPEGPRDVATLVQQRAPIEPLDAVTRERGHGARLQRIPLLICDEVGYIPFDPQAANLML
jgi:hypothetical protein